MKFVARTCCLPVLVAAAFCFINSGDRVWASAGVEIYSTGFEEAEGYDSGLDLGGQNGWVFDGAGGNGLITNVFPSSAQQAYIGFDPDPATNAFLYLWQPINLDPVPAATPVIQFTVSFTIIDSTEGEFDNFSFEVFNAQGDSLLIVDFDNFTLKVRYALNAQTNFTESGIFFENAVIYDLILTMDFEYNVWRAVLSDGVDATLLAGGQRISNGAPLNFGDVSILWHNAAGFPLGNNYMVFDDYQITAYPKPQVEWLGFNAGGDARIRLFGETGSAYAIEIGDTTDEWTPVFTNTLTGAFFDYTNVNALPLNQRLYRGRLVQ